MFYTKQQHSCEFTQKHTFVPQYYLETLIIPHKSPKIFICFAILKDNPESNLDVFQGKSFRFDSTSSQRGTLMTR